MDGWICVIRKSLDETKSYIDKLRNECYKANRDPKDVHITAVLYPDVIGYRHSNNSNTDNKKSGEEGFKSKQRQRQLKGN